MYKGTVDLIPSYPPFIELNVRFALVPPLQLGIPTQVNFRCAQLRTL